MVYKLILPEPSAEATLVGKKYWKLPPDIGVNNFTVNLNVCKRQWYLFDNLFIDSTQKRRSAFSGECRWVERVYLKYLNCPKLQVKYIYYKELSHNDVGHLCFSHSPDTSRSNRRSESPNWSSGHVKRPLTRTCRVCVDHVLIG